MSIFSPLAVASLLLISPAVAQTPPPSEELDIPPSVVEESPLLQKWLQETPNILEEIRHEPSFRTRIELGAIAVPDEEVGIKIAVEDVFLGNTGLTLSADYQSFSDIVTTGADLHYFLFPLGGFVNLAPTVGYRYLEQEDFDTDGVNLGLRLMLVLSRTGAADISIVQSWLNPGGNSETGLLKLEVGYSVIKQVRLATGWKRLNSPEDSEDVFSIGLEYLF